MIYIFTLLSVLFLQIFSLQQNNPKLCINCKHFINNDMSNIFGKCAFFSRKDDNNTYMLVNGNQQYKYVEYIFCSIARKHDDMCGPEGKMYVKKYKKRDPK